MAKGPKSSRPAGTSAAPNSDDEATARTGEDAARAALDEVDLPSDDAAGGEGGEGSIGTRTVDGDAPGGRPKPAAKDNFEKDPRDAIASAFQKGKAGGALDEDDDDDAGDDEDERGELHGDDSDDDQAVIVDHRTPAERRAEAAEPRKPQRVEIDDDQLVVVKVNGQDVELPWSEVKAGTQKNLVADQRFDEATRLLREARDVTARKDSPRRDADDAAGNQGDETRRREDAAPTDPDRKPIDRARLREFADKIQGGSVEDGAEALANLVEDLTARSGNQLNRAEIVAQIRQEMAEDSEVTRAVSTFQADYGDVFSPTGEHAELGSAVFRGLSNEMLADLRGVGVPEDYIASLKSPREILDAHQHYRTDPEFNGAAWRSKLRNYEGLLLSSADKIAEKYGIPRLSDREDEPAPRREVRTNGNGDELGSPRARVTISERRQVEKRALPMQPRPASVRSDQREVNQAPRLTAERMGNAVASLRRERQQTV